MPTDTSTLTGATIRRTLLEIIDERAGEPSTLQAGAVLEEARRRLKIQRDISTEQALLTAWYDLFRTGLLAWGYNLQNPDPPFVHTASVGRRALAQLSRDPHNPEGYLAAVQGELDEFPVANSYIREALDAYVAGLPRAAAVLVGAAAESLVLEVRDALVARLAELGQTPQKRLTDWRVKTVRDAVANVLDEKRPLMDRDLRERYEAFWVPISDQIRLVRNDAGHPSSLDPIHEETVHANLLLFPEFLRLVRALIAWIRTSLQ